MMVNTMTKMRDDTIQTPPIMQTPISSASVGSVTSECSDDSHVGHNTGHNGALLPPVLVYHESARSIVFRDHLRRAAATDSQPSDLSADLDNALPASEAGKVTEGDTTSVRLSDFTHVVPVDVGAAGHTSERSVEETNGFQPNIVPLPNLQLGQRDEYMPLLSSDKDSTYSHWTEAEREVVQMLEQQKAVAKTIKNDDWTNFLHRFKTAHTAMSGRPNDHTDIAPHDKYLFNSFVTSTTLLPPCGKKMRCYGNPSVYTTGVVFALPEFNNSDDEAAAVDSTRTWSWPSGYSAKTEFNIDSRGNLINGRQEALVPLSTIRSYNRDYLDKTDYVIGGRVVKGGLKTVPYNEVFVRVGGQGRIVGGVDCATGSKMNDSEGTGRSFETGVGLPVALFVRTATFGHLISLLRTRARLLHVLGEKHSQSIPLLLISPDIGVRVLTEELQLDLLKIASKSLNPFQNPMIAYKTTIDQTDEACLEVKLEELIDLDEGIRQTLTPEECVRLAGGFGATDDSIAQILKDAMIQDKESSKLNGDSHRLQDIVNEGLASAVRSGDFFTSRQLLILYSLVASEGHKMSLEDDVDRITDNDGKNERLLIREQPLDSEAMLLQRQGDESKVTMANSRLPPPPPPPPLDTDRLRSATNSDGLLAVLGAAQVLKAMQDGSAKRRTEESFLSVEE